MRKWLPWNLGRHSSNLVQVLMTPVSRIKFLVSVCYTNTHGSISDKAEESEMVELFLKEAVLMKDFQHQHVLGIRGITFAEDATPMVVLPYMANGDLRNYILNPALVILNSVKLEFSCLPLFSHINLNSVHHDWPKIN